MQENLSNLSVGTHTHTSLTNKRRNEKTEFQGTLWDHPHASQEIIAVSRSGRTIITNLPLKTRNDDENRHHHRIPSRQIPLKSSSEQRTIQSDTDTRPNSPHARQKGGPTGLLLSYREGIDSCRVFCRHLRASVASIRPEKSTPPRVLERNCSGARVSCAPVSEMYQAGMFSMKVRPLSSSSSMGAKMTTATFMVDSRINKHLRPSTIRANIKSYRRIETVQIQSCFICEIKQLLIYFSQFVDDFRKRAVSIK